MRGEMPYKVRNTKRMPCDDGQEDWSDISTSKGTPRNDSHCQKPGRGRIGFYSESQMEPRSMDTLISDLHPPELWEHISVVWSHLVCCAPRNWHKTSGHNSSKELKWRQTSWKQCLYRPTLLHQLPWTIQLNEIWLPPLHGNRLQRSPMSYLSEALKEPS